MYIYMCVYMYTYIYITLGIAGEDIIAVFCCVYLCIPQYVGSPKQRNNALTLAHDQTIYYTSN